MKEKSKRLEELSKLFDEANGGLVPVEEIDKIWDPRGSTNCKNNRQNLIYQLRSTGVKVKHVKRPQKGYILES